MNGRNYLLLFAEKQSNSLIPIPFISVMNRYGIPIFFINVVENRKNTPLIYKPKKAQGNASLYKIPLTFKGKKIYRCTKKSSNIYSKFSARCTILNLFLHSLPFLSRFYKVFWKSFIKFSHSVEIHSSYSEYIPLIFTPKNQWVEPKYFLHL